ncbi:outer membrane protein assembly factor BamB family protein [Urbifossiella limnaea]|uniref:Outer membrane biogenesis protein BamB n=1 Tax=Urbifossiella limnaea TaxID=2528023 RepID=A0A517XWW9_9BACT|nr:PQQ-binding-like beta-propeller repeat protein [Urbifossiella limnaea]QDU22003.1 outer membrane biogenesis protein BamB [Urbifossiella limnaea]
MPRSSVVVTLFALSTPLLAADWPHWRGPTRDGHTGESSGWADGRWLPDRPAWTANVGAGASSPLVVGDSVYVLGRTSGHDALRCLDVRDGKTLWTAQHPGPLYGRFHAGDEGFYSGPSATPEYDPQTKFLYTLAPDGDLRCRDAAAAGKHVWAVNLYDAYGAKQRPRVGRSPVRDYGYTSSPLVHGGWLLVEVGSPRGTLVAFDKRTGTEAWRSELTDEAGHTAGPVPITVEGVPCVAVLTMRHLAVIRLDAGRAGKTVAAVPWETEFANNVASPAVRDNFVVVTSAYNQNAISKLRVTLTGATEVWRKRFPSKVCTPVVVGGHLYLAWQRLRCLDWETGEQRWEGGAFGDAGSCVATADGRLVVYGGTGKLALVEGAARSPTAYTELAVRDRVVGAVAWPHVALAGGRVFCRDREGTLACFTVGK